MEYRMRGKFRKVAVLDGFVHAIFVAPEITSPPTFKYGHVIVPVVFNLPSYGVIHTVLAALP